MTRTTPFDEMERFFEQMRRSMFDAPFAAGDRTGSTALRMETDEDGYVVHADLPGFETDEIELWFADGTLSVEALHETEGEDGVRRRRVSEEIRVPGDVLEDDVEAEYHNGVLEVRLPTVADVERSGRRIDIE